MRLLLVFVSLASLTTGQQPESLFDGRTLAGWRGAEGIWSVEDGCIKGSTVGQAKRQNTYLIWEGGELADFELRFDVQLEGANNSGVQYRSRELPGGNFVVAGYQCDVHPAADFFGMLYEERGAGVLCRHGEFLARDADGGTRIVGRIGKGRARDLAQWHSFRIRATGNLLEHFVDDVPVAIIMDDAREAPRQGIIALQVHGGAEMTVRFKNLELVRFPPEEVAKLPPLVDVLLQRDQSRARRVDEAVPQWIWDDAAQDEDDVFFRREFEIVGEPTAGQVLFTCDNQCRVYVNGRRIGACSNWFEPVARDVGSALQAGRNVVAVHGWNEGGPAALAVRLVWRVGDERGEVVTDASWRCSNDDPKGWQDLGFADEAWTAASAYGGLGAEGLVWSNSVKAGALSQGSMPEAPQVALPAEGLAGAGAEGALHLLDVPRGYGSWVSLCADDKGRLYASDQGSGLYRITPANGIGGLSSIEKVDVELGGAQGLCWFEDSLYAVVSVRKQGLYRLRDTDGDDRLDEVELLRKLGGGGEHGPHAIVPAPDGENLIVVIGNHVKLTEIAVGMPDYEWGEDRLLPKMEDPRGHAKGLEAPGGYICKVDPSGQHWQLLCWGFRNTYDVAVLPNGDLYTYDADMEWDMGLPWYRPTRILEVVPGVDYGWRSGSNKWPVDYPESPRAVCDVGPGSPTGVVTHGGSVLALDWTFGTIYALPIGSREPVQWITGVPFPVSDAVSVGDHLYVITGGRGLPSKLFRIDAEPPAAVASTMPDVTPAAQPLLRELVAAAHKDQPHKDQPHEFGADDLWALSELYSKFPFAELSQADRIAWLRVHALVVMRALELGDPEGRLLTSRFVGMFPTGDDRVDADFAELLVYLDAPGLVDLAIPMLSPLRPAQPPAWADVVARNSSYGGVIEKMLGNMPPTGQIAIANALRHVRHGWTLDQRRALFEFFAAARTRTGGASYDGYLKAMVDEFWESCTPAEQSLLADVADKARADLPKFRSTRPKGPGRAWQLADARQVVAGSFEGADLASGHNLFHATGCASCHYFAGEGGNHGPDLTSLGNKFARGDVLEAILEPSKVISDQYSGSVVKKHDGTSVFGRAVPLQRDGVDYWEVVPAVAEAEPVLIPVAEVAEVEPSKLSPMPAGLVDALNPQELRDLVAFLQSRGRGLLPEIGDPK